LTEGWYLNIVSAIMFDQIKRLANKKDVPYQSLMKVFLAEKVKEEARIV
jgi:hypothetical protein